MSGKVLIQWRHCLCRDIARKRYMDPETTRSMHIDIANIFFNQEQDDSDEISSEHNSGEANGREARIEYIHRPNVAELFLPIRHQ